MQNFDSIYNEHYPNVFSWIKYKLNNAEAAEELAADIFVKVYNNLHEFDENKSKMKTWIMSITKNAIIDFFRTDKSSLTMSLTDMIDDDGNETFQHVDNVTPESLLQNEELGCAITAAINELPASQRTIADMFMLQELSHEEISARLGDIPIGTIKGTIHRAKQMLQTRLLNF